MRQMQKLFCIIAEPNMNVSSFFVFFIAITFSWSLIPYSVAISVYKATGSLYFGVIPPITGKATHKTLPPPNDEGIKILSDASYYLHKTNNQVSKIYRKFFGDDEETDTELNPGVYTCENGLCKEIELDEKQRQKFNESLKGKTIKVGNALTKKLKHMEANSNVVLPPPPLLETNHINFEEMERRRKLDATKKNNSNSNVR